MGPITAMPFVFKNKKSKESVKGNLTYVLYKKIIVVHLAMHGKTVGRG